MSFAPSELRKQIDDLSSEIEVQRAVLDDLINRRRQAQHNLNAVLDPMARLPLELQSKIFVHCLCSDEDERASKPDPQLAPMIFSNVSQLWRDIALSTPELWTHPANRICTGRGQLLPTGTSDLAEGVKHFIDCSARRVEEFSLLLLTDLHYQYRVPLLPFRSLKKLHIVLEEEKSFRMHDWIDVMRMSPGLLHCTFSASFSLHVIGEDFEPFTLTALTELHLKERSSSNPGNVNPTILFRYITLPALERLHIHCRLTLPSLPDVVSDLSDFIIRSDPPLRSLVIDDSTSDWVAILERLAAPSLLPNLEHLACRRRIWERRDLEVFVRMLDVWSLKTFRLNITTIGLFDGAAVPDEDILVELRRIRDSGVDIYIGDEQRNFL
ncbi:hypothetical protein R3P38DRAFT_3219247 [Favolaschia claudopus]|uniref:F-box domain-containing protein n=1 Tax=Favolaschia claudopus TaxID=2862362 RepID=A0AAW0A3E9_9AGAR